MPAQSKSQQRLFGMVTALKENKLSNAPAKVKEVAKHISKAKAKDFARTEHEDLPEKVSSCDCNEHASKTVHEETEKGMEREKEHTKDKEMRCKLVKDHLKENPKYYSILNKAMPEGEEEKKAFWLGFDSVIKQANAQQAPQTYQGQGNPFPKRLQQVLNMLTAEQTPEAIIAAVDPRKQLNQAT